MHFSGEKCIHWCILIFSLNYSRSIYKNESEFNINFVLNIQRIALITGKECMFIIKNEIICNLDLHRFIVFLFCSCCFIYLYIFVSYCCLWLEQTSAAFSEIRNVILPILMWLSRACERIEYLVVDLEVDSSFLCFID